MLLRCDVDFRARLTKQAQVDRTYILLMHICIRTIVLPVLRRGVLDDCTLNRNLDNGFDIQVGERVWFCILRSRPIGSYSSVGPFDREHRG